MARPFVSVFVALAQALCLIRNDKTVCERTRLTVHTKALISPYRKYPSPLSQISLRHLPPFILPQNCECTVTMFIHAQEFPRERENTADTCVPTRRKRKGKARAALLSPINTTARPSITPLSVSVTPNGTACFPEPPSAIDVSYAQVLTTEEEEELRHQLSRVTCREPPTPQDHDHENDCRPRQRPELVHSPGSSSSVSTLSPQTPGDFEHINPTVRERLGSISLSRLSLLAASEIYPPSKNSGSYTGDSKAGPFTKLRELQFGSYACTYAVRDMATSRVVCVKKFLKRPTSSSRQFYVGLLTELIAYQHISSADENSRKFLMELHGVVQDTESVMYVMVRLIYFPSSLFVILKPNIRTL